MGKGDQMSSSPEAGLRREGKTHSPPGGHILAHKKGQYVKGKFLATNAATRHFLLKNLRNPSLSPHTIRAAIFSCPSALFAFMPRKAQKS